MKHLVADRRKPQQVGSYLKQFLHNYSASNYVKSCFMIEIVSDLLEQKQNNKIKGYQI